MGHAERAGAEQEQAVGSRTPAPAQMGSTSGTSPAFWGAVVPRNDQTRTP
jgi:hypothetical protein